MPLKTTAFIPNIAILDARITLSMPKHVVAETGMDAMTPALPYVLEYNSQDGEVQQKLDYLASAIRATDFIDGIKRLNKKLNIPENFNKMGITSQEFEHNFEELLDNSLQGSTQSNPISIDRTQMEQILWSIFLGKPSW